MYTEKRIRYSDDFNIQEDRRSYPASFKAQVVLAALKENKSLAELAMEYAVHPGQISLWKQQLLNNISLVFENTIAHPGTGSKTANNPHAKIGQLMAENDFLTKVLGR